MDSENQFLKKFLPDGSITASDSISARSVPPVTSVPPVPLLLPIRPVIPELQGIGTFPLVSPPRRAIVFNKPKEYREYQHPIPPMSPTPLPAHCNSTAWGRGMTPMYSPFNLPFSYYPGYFGTLAPYYSNNEDLFLPPHAHNNLPLARLVYRAMRYNPVYRPLLGRNPPLNIPQDLSKSNRKNTIRHLCVDCKKTYATLYGLSKHQKFHCPVGNSSKKTLTCKQCNKVCDSFAKLKMHTKSHGLPCKCNLCDKSFSRSWLLQGHMRTHTGEKPFICQQCKRSFADRSNLKAHVQAHNYLKKYSCSICTKTFSRMSLLLKHTEANCPAQQAFVAAMEKSGQIF